MGYLWGSIGGGLVFSVPGAAVLMVRQLRDFNNTDLHEFVIGNMFIRGSKFLIPLAFIIVAAVRSITEVGQHQPVLQFAANPVLPTLVAAMQSALRGYP